MGSVSFSRRGRRAYLYPKETALDRKVVGSVGVVLYEERDSVCLFCSAINNIVTLSLPEIRLIWQEEEVKKIRKYNLKNLDKLEKIC